LLHAKPGDGDLLIRRLLPGFAAHLLSAIRHGSVSAAADALTRIRNRGATSGIALAWGICAAAGDVIDARALTTNEESHDRPSTIAAVHC
jgi:hypothetical protein